MTIDDFFSTDTGSTTVGTTTLVLTVPRAVAAGKKLVLAHGRADVAGSTISGLASVTDSKGNTWAVNSAVSIRANQGAVAFAYCDLGTALAAGDTITATLSTTAARKFMDVWVCSGLLAGGPSATSGATATANTNSNANGASTTPTASLTTTTANSVLFGAGYFGGSGVPAGAGSGYTLDSTRATTDAAPKGWASEHGTAATAGAKSIILSQAASSAWAMAAVAFSPVGNVPPIADAGAAQVNVQPYSTVQLDGTASSDPDGIVVSYAWTQTGGVPVTLTGANTSSPTYRAPGTLAGDTQTFQLVVADVNSATSTATTSVQVRPTPEQIMTASGWAPAKLALITADPGSTTGGGGTPTPGLTLTVTPEPGFTPPRFRIDVTDTSATPASQVTVTRRDPDGHTVLVRTADGGPQPLSAGQATLYDYEAPYGEPIAYSTDAGGATVLTEMDVSRPWLVHPGIPSRSATFRQLAGSANQEVWDIDQGTFQVLERDTPLTFTGGARVAPAGTLLIGAATPDELAALKLLLSDGSVLLLNVPSALGWGIDTCYIAVGSVRATRLSPQLSDGWRSVELPYQVVSRPAGGTQAAITWNTIAGLYSSWKDAAASVSSWAELSAPTTV